MENIKEKINTIKALALITPLELSRETKIKPDYITHLLTGRNPTVKNMPNYKSLYKAVKKIGRIRVKNLKLLELELFANQ